MKIMAFVALTLFLLLPILTGAEGTKQHGSNSLENFLDDLQSKALQLHQFTNGTFDPKLYVDLPLKHSLPFTQAAFSHDKRAADKDHFKDFVEDYFFKPGSDILNYSLPDFEEPAGFLPKVTDPLARTFALKIHARWKKLARKVSDDVAKHPTQHTLLPLPNAVVVPGARFREVYYWDTYWIVRGLLVSKLYKTATSVVENLIHLAERHGFVPNGSRTYYLNRSQPPLLSEAVKAVYSKTGNLSLLHHALPALMKEHSFWSSEHHRVHIRDSHGVKHALTRYGAKWDSPRPESYTIDEKTAESLTDRQERAELFHQIASAAETGWDFSSRWMANRQNLTTLKTSYILPVDLNSYMYQMENNIAMFARLLGKRSVEKKYHELAKSRKKAINSIFWNEEMGQYLDYWLVKRDSTVIGCDTNSQIFYKENQNRDIFPSNFFPLWTGIVSPGEERLNKLISSFKTSGLLLPGGITTSLKQTGEQWDYPNAWPPLVHLLAEGFAKSRTKEGLALAEEISKRWLVSNYVAFESYGEMLEKYDARYCGKSGAGGEYQPQAGFGWSNGVLLSLLERFGWPAGTNFTCQA